MKVLIVSENDKTISCLKSFFKTQDGYETITYRTPVKAMDNFSEISPNLMVLSAVDFPKHWKIFMQYVSVARAATCDTVLIVDKKFDAKEKEKASVLGVWKILNESKLHKFVASAAAGTVKFIDVVSDEKSPVGDFSPEKPDGENSAAGSEQEKEQAAAPQKTNVLDEQFEEALREQEMLLERERDALSGSTEPPPESDASAEAREMSAEESAAFAESLAPPKADPREVQFMFRHPKSDALVTGLVETATEGTIVFRPDFHETLETLDSGDLVTSATYKNGESITLVNAYAMPWDDTIHFTLARNETS
jgi:hypothetical protein